jgi:hypothetical protein
VRKEMPGNWTFEIHSRKASSSLANIAEAFFLLDLMAALPSQPALIATACHEGTIRSHTAVVGKKRTRANGLRHQRLVVTIDY